MIIMTEEEALDRLHEITAGIDEVEGAYGSSGWWETSAGAAFGAERLRRLESLISELAE
jgi:hypothetical protein